MKTNFLSPMTLALIVCGFFQSTAQIGINTSNPQASLDVLSKGNTGATKAMRINNSGNTENCYRNRCRKSRYRNFCTTAYAPFYRNFKV
jgi:hypothetical protein